MSKAGTHRRSKQDEVMALVNEAAEKKLLTDTLAEQQAAMEREQRIHNLWWQCKFSILNKMGGVYSLPGEVLGAEIAEMMLRQIYTRMLAQAQERQRAGEIDVVKPGDIRVASALVR